MKPTSVHPDAAAQLKRFGAMVHDAMLRLNLSAQVLGYQCGVPSEEIVLITKGEFPATVDHLARIASCLGMELWLGLVPKNQRDNEQNLPPHHEEHLN